MVSLHNLFPTPVGFAELGRLLSDEELFFIRELPTRPNMVPTVEGDDNRISLSFNTFPVGLVGEEMDLTGLKLEA